MEKKLSMQKEFYFFVSLLQLFGLKSLPHSNKLRENVTNEDEELKQEIEIEEERKEKCEGDKVVDIDDHLSSDVIISLNELIEYLCQYNEEEEEEEEEEEGQKCEVDDYILLDMVYECLIIIEQNNIYQVYIGDMYKNCTITCL